MLHKYRKIDPIKAEQFDGSLEVMKKYHITDDGFDEMYTFRFGITSVNWVIMSDEKFHRTYERCD